MAQFMILGQESLQEMVMTGDEVISAFKNLLDV